LSISTVFIDRMYASSGSTLYALRAMTSGSRFDTGGVAPGGGGTGSFDVCKSELTTRSYGFVPGGPVGGGIGPDPDEVMIVVNPLAV
jgi:hypothetical protein